MGKKKTILFAIDALYGGGAEKVLIYILERLDRSKYDISLFLFTRCGEYLKKVPDDVRLFYLFKDPGESRNRVVRFLRLAARSLVIRLAKRFTGVMRLLVRLPVKYDCGVSFCEGINLLFFAGLRGRFLRCVSWIHLDLQCNSFALSTAEFSRALKKYEDVVFVSRGNRESFLHVFPDFDRARLHVVHNPVDVAGILQKSADVGTITLCPPGRFRIVSVGRFVPVKRFDRLIRACKILHESACPFELFILGAGPAESQLRHLVASMNLESDVHLVPFQANPYPWLRSADVFVSSSDSEGLPLVVTEAMILGIPIVATRTVGAVELLEDGKYGFLTDFSEEGLAGALIRFYREPQLRESCRKTLWDAFEKKLLPFSSSLENVEKIL